jgi:hypothetical protein
VDERAGLDVKKRKFLTLPGLELQLVASRYTDYAIPAPRNTSINFIIFISGHLDSETLSSRTVPSSVFA